MHNTTVYSNRANNGNGGGIHIGQSGGHNINCKISMVECQFTNNTANQGSGGAIYKSTDGSNVNSMPVTKCQFINNTASISGGAIFKTEENEELIIDQNIYENNMANALILVELSMPVVQIVRLL